MPGWNATVVRRGACASPSGCRGSMPRSVSTRMMRPTSTTRPGPRSRRCTPRRVVAIGETGLDYDRVFSPIPDQLTNLRRNLASRSRPASRRSSIAARRDRTARRAGTPSSASCARSARTCQRSSSTRSAGPLDYAEAMLELGAAISISGLAFPKGEEATAEVVRLVPAGPPPRRDRFAVPLAARRPARPERARVGPGDRNLGRRGPWQRAGICRRRPRRSL